MDQKRPEGCNSKEEFETDPGDDPPLTCSRNHQGRESTLMVRRSFSMDQRRPFRGSLVCLEEGEEGEEGGGGGGRATALGRERRR